MEDCGDYQLYSTGEVCNKYLISKKRLHFQNKCDSDALNYVVFRLY